MTDPKLKSLVERAEKIIEERKSVSEDLRDIFSEAKGVGYEPRYMRKLIGERAMDAADLAEQEAVMDAYRHALGMAAAAVSNGDMSLREAAKQSGFSKSAIHRVSHQMRDSDGGTVEMTDADLGTLEPVREMIADDVGDPLWVVDRERAKFRDKVRSIAGKVKVPPRDEIGHPASSTDAPPDNPIPSRLDRRHELVRQ